MLALRVMPQRIFTTRLIGIIILLLLFMIWAHLQLIENMDTLAGEDFLRPVFRMGMEKDGGSYHAHWQWFSLPF